MTTSVWLNGMLEALKAGADGIARKPSGGGGQRGGSGDGCTPCAAHAYVESLRAPQPTLSPSRRIRSPSKGRR